MAGVQSIDFTARTLERLRDRGLEILRQRVGEYRYGSFIGTDLAPAMIEVFAWYQEQNAHYYDRRRINSLLSLADNRDDMVILTRAQGYRMRPATSASVAVLANPLPPAGAPITLSKGTRLTAGDLTFEVAEDVVIPAGVTQWPDGTTDDLIVLVEGRTQTDTFFSDGTEFQEFELSLPGTIDGSVEVTIAGQVWDEVASLVFIEGDRRGRDSFTGEGVDSQEVVLTDLNAVFGLEDEDGIVLFVQPSGQPAASAERWTQVTAFTGAPQEFVVTQDLDGTTRIQFGEIANGAAPNAGDAIDVFYLVTGSQRRYALTYDPDDRATIRFGDGLFGVIPPNGSTISVSYRVGGGVRGNVPAGTIDGNVRGLLPNGARAAVRLRNFENARGGEPPESVERARFFAPRVTRSNQRAVTQSDWTAWAATYADPLYGAPSYANAFLKQNVPELNTVCVAVWARDETGQVSTPSSPLKAGIKNLLDSKRTITTVAEMKDGTVVLLDIEIDVVLEAGTTRQVVFAAITTAIERFFSSTFVLPGVDVSVSNLYRRIQDTDGVESAEIVRITGSLAAVIALGIGDGNTTRFAFNFPLDEGTTVVTGSVRASDGTQSVIDDGAGTLTGDVDVGAPPGDNDIDYATGEGVVTFAEAPALGSSVQVSAKLGHFFEHVEDLGPSDGNVASLNAGTRYYPIVKRAARGVWSGDQQKVIDAFRVGLTNRFRGSLPGGIIPSTLAITDSNGVPLVGNDNGAGVIVGAGILSGSIDYDTGDIDFEFNAAVTLPVFVSWETRTLDLLVDEEFLPLSAGRVFVWAGFSVDGVQPGGAELIAVDDGQGNIVGDVLVGGSIQYQTGRVRAEFNAEPPPGAAGGALFTATLVPAPDGVTREFTFSLPGDLSRTGSGGEGRTRLVLSGLSTPGVTFEDAYDNWQGALHGASLDLEGSNAVQYSLGTGTLTFLTPPAAGAPATFDVQVTNVATLMVAGWVYRVPTPGGIGLDKGLFADNNGRLWGPPGAGSSNPFPTDRLEHARGQYVAALAGTPVAAGRSQELTYDALTGVPPVLNIPIDGDEVAALGLVTLNEKPPETTAF